jgi:hypothetical protein
MISLQNKIKIKYYKLLSFKHWEFLPANIFYIPVFFYYIFLMLKYRISFTAISAVNPCFAAGGMAFDSKYDMISKFFSYPESVAKTILIDVNKKENLLSIEDKIQKNDLNYPVICKPDRGHRGNGFKIIRNRNDLLEYMKLCNRNFLIQEYIEYPLEYGVFWVKIPSESKGRITSITRKILPFLKGDGKSSLSELILSDKRAKYMASAYFEKNKNHLDTIIAAETNFRICSAGNHCQGAIFEDGSKDIEGKTFKRLEEIFSSVKGYDFGRMDIKFKDKDALSNGKNFKILEVNGSEAESTHIYDRKYSLFYAYKTLYNQWDTLFKIARENRKNGFYGLSASRMLRSYLDFFEENNVIQSD